MCPGQAMRGRQLASVLPMSTAADLQRWQRLDDVIMGGRSSSMLQVDETTGDATFSGTLILEGGGFCGARTEVPYPRCRAFFRCTLDVPGEEVADFCLIPFPLEHAPTCNVTMPSRLRNVPVCSAPPAS